jgi:hypothetical protein
MSASTTCSSSSAAGLAVPSVHPPPPGTGTLHDDSVRGAPRLDKAVAGDPAVARQYDELAAQKKAAVLQYAARVLRECGPPPRASVVDGLPEIVLQKAARATPEEVAAATSVAMPEEGSFATALNQRGRRACGLQPNQSFRLRDSDGALTVLTGSAPVVA